MKIVTLNCENLFLSTEDLPSVGTHNYLKVEDKTVKLAEAILDINADIYCLQEVGGESSLKWFCKTFLHSNFDYAIIPGNSNRNIHIAYLIKNTSKLTYKILSNNQLRLNLTYPNHTETELLSRDISELHILENQTPILILLGLHLKSQLDSENIDERGINKRTAEMILLAKISNSLKVNFPRCPQIIMGDFNNIFSQDLPEYSKFKQQCPAFTDILEIMNVVPSDRGTHMYFNEQGTRFVTQLDYILLDNTLQKQVSHKTSGIYRYKDDDGTAYPLPDSNLQRYVMASDHFPVVCEFLMKTSLEK